MEIGKGKFIFWLLTTLAIGLACGYLFSSKFCRVTIGRRVEKISTLNQSLRNLFALRAFYNFEYLQAQVFKTPNQETISTRLNKVNEEISNLVGAYYDRKAVNKLHTLLNEQSRIEEFSTLLAQLNPTWALSIEHIKENLATSEVLSAKIQEALSNKNWEQALNLFEKNVSIAMEFADELDRGITQQFPHKF
jgi:hypothetical protein